MSVLESERSGPLDDPFADRRLLVLLASYRDPELSRTISDALTQAAYPEHLRFAICHQHDAETVADLASWEKDPRFTIDTVHHDQSSGCCWARARTFDMYDGEPYILQVDAHTRFAARWDQRFINMLESLDNQKSILTCYPPSYTVEDNGEDTYQLDGTIQRLTLERLNRDLTTRQQTEIVENTTAPGPSAFLAAGQIFSRGSFCTDVPYDPEIYFGGEEISLAVRAFTHGYDLFYPNENLIWHRYDHGVPLHWDDNPDRHTQLHETAVERLRLLLSDRGTGLGPVGLGTTRSLADYEHMAEIDFSKAGEGEGEGWSLAGELELDTTAIDFSVSYESWVFAVLAENDTELGRDDITDHDVLRGSTRTTQLDMPDLEDRPAKYIIWPVFADGTFGERTEHRLDPELVTGPENPALHRPEPAAQVAAAGPAPTKITIDRSVIEPRDDYTRFVVVFLDSQGVELSRSGVVRPDVLDLSVGEFDLHDIDTRPAVAYAVLPTRRDGTIGAIRVQPLDRA